MAVGCSAVGWASSSQILPKIDPLIILAEMPLVMVGKKCSPYGTYLQKRSIESKVIARAQRAPWPAE